jgi:hypothetical protein
MAFSASLTTGNTFSNGDSATAAKLNAQVNAATFGTTAANTFIDFDTRNAPVDGAATLPLALTDGALALAYGTGLGSISNSLGMLYRPTVLTTAVTMLSNATLAPVTQLTIGLPVGTYAFAAQLYASQAGNAGYQFGLTFVTGAATMFKVFGLPFLAQAGLQTQFYASFLPASIAIQTTNVGDACFMLLSGGITVSVGGQLKIEFAQQTSSVFASTLETGSVFSAQTI